jgi:hypothetical protein
MSGTSRQKIVADRNTINLSWYTYSDNKLWSQLISSYNVIRPRVLMNAGLIVAANSENTLLAVRRAEISLLFDLFKEAADSKNTADTNNRINQLVTRINNFLSIAPLP